METNQKQFLYRLYLVAGVLVFLGLGIGYKIFHIQYVDGNDYRKIGGIANKESKAVFLSVWDHKPQETLKIDLWTKDMLVDDMKKFYHQTLLSMADSFKRSTNEDEISEDIRDFAKKLNFSFKDTNMIHIHANMTQKIDDTIQIMYSDDQTGIVIPENHMRII